MRIRAGTSGFSYAAWKGKFYPPHLPSRLMLAHYATRLPTVEANSTFYRMPRPETLASWRAEVPPGFSFALKAPQRLTHARRLRDAADLVAVFHGAAAELGDALGPVLYQLPPTLKRDAALLADFLAALPRGKPAAFEFRHRSWLDDGVLDLLRRHGAALCVADTDEESTPLVATGRFGYLRLRRAAYSAADLRRWALGILGQGWSEAFVYFKHEDEARGPAFALAFRELLESAGALAGDDVSSGGARC